MSGYSDDRYDYNDNDPDREERESGRRDDNRDADVISRPRSSTSLPGIFLVLNGLFGLVCTGLLAVPMVFQPEMIIDGMRGLAKDQPPGPEKQQMDQDIDDAEKQIQQNRVATQVEGAIELGVMVLGNLLAIIGGFKMRSLSSYPLALAGAIISMIPCLTGCCVTGMLFGLWAIIALMNADVKEGFAARSRMRYSPDSY